MTLKQSLLSVLVFFTTAVGHGQTYFAQNQHNAFFLFGNSAESLTSNCYIRVMMLEDEERIPDQEGVCTFHFTTREMRTNLELRYEDLKVIQPYLIEELQEYVNNLKQNYPPNILQRTFLFRDMDYDYLDMLVNDLRDRPLPYKVLLRRDFQNEDVPHFFSRTITEDVMEIFKRNLEPLKTR